MAIALLGAGFSRSWGGWLAQEIVGELLGRLVSEPKLYGKLRQTENFELLFWDVREGARIHPLPERVAAAAKLEEAILEVFAEMNRAFALLPGLEFIDRPDFSVTAFLSLFEEIYTLNQDLLLEAHYIPSPRARRWKGPIFPGIVSPRDWPQMTPQERMLGRWELATSITTQKDRQSIFKLHGSVNWREKGGSRLLVLGGGKEKSIGASPLLNGYFEHFTAKLMAGNTRLMVIGYSFRDEHINRALLKANKEAGLQVYIVDPRGLDVLNKYLAGQLEITNPLRGLRIVGASSRTLDAVFKGDSLQLQSLMRFAEA